jgi:hypothetical protein
VSSIARWCQIIEGQDGCQPERTLTESNGPFVKISERTTIPADIQMVEITLARIWSKLICGAEYRGRGLSTIDETTENA